MAAFFCEHDTEVTMCELDKTLFFKADLQGVVFFWEMELVVN